jgi:hypothetical protein
MRTSFGQVFECKLLGFGLITATFIFVTFFWGVPEIFRPIWVALQSWIPENGAHFVFGMTWLLHTTIYGISNIVMYFVYKSKFNFFERYKISSVDRLTFLFQGFRNLGHGKPTIRNGSQS